MRSFAEIAFRARQEAANLYLLLSRPRFRGTVSRELALPNPHSVIYALLGSDYAHSVAELANKLMTHRFPILGLEVQTGPEIRWRRPNVPYRLRWIQRQQDAGILIARGHVG